MIGVEEGSRIFEETPRGAAGEGSYLFRNVGKPDPFSHLGKYG